MVKFAEFQDILRYNDFQHDEYSDGNPWNAICSRGDLASENPSPSGCKSFVALFRLMAYLGYDTKVTRYDAMKDTDHMGSWVISGPTTSHGLPVFNWDKFSSYPHEGLPDTFADHFIKM